MANYVLDPIGVVENLRSLLRDQYDPRSVFKELVQNADDANSQDAHASVLHLAQHNGWPDHSNSLLRVPALLVLNNGPFLVKDAIAFNKIGIGSKSGDDFAIGKFGRGLKSIFHLCEAFFYFGSADQVGLQGAEYGGHPNAGLLNPWEGTGYHPEWSCNAEVLSLLKDTIDSWPQGSPTWFCLWIPLKCAALLDGTTPIVQPAMCGLEEILTEDFARRAAELLPLLRNLDTITFWQDLSVRKVSVHRKSDALRRRYPANATGRDDQNPVSGRIEGTLLCVEENGQKQRSFYSGQEILSQDPVFEQMRRREDWPTVSVWVQETGGSTQDKDKTRPHAAAVFQQLPSGRTITDALQISRAVFLPLTDSEESLPLREPDASYRLHLHGCYFVDAGRRDVVLTAAPAQEEYANPHKTLARTWNTALEQRAVLPLVLPSLRDFAAGASLSFSQIHGLTAALHHSKLLAGKEASLCARHFWLARLTSAGAEWGLLPGEAPYYVLPAPPDKQPALPFSVLPGLSHLSQEHVLTYAELPRLTARRPASWQSFLPELLAGVPVEQVFSHPEMLDYLTDFFEATATAWQDEAVNTSVRHTADSIHNSLLEMVREAFHVCGVKTLRQHALSVRRLFAHLSPDAVMLLPATLPSTLQDALAALPTFPVLLPADLWPNMEATGMFSPLQAAKAMAWLEAAEVSQKLRSDIALAILSRTTGEMEQKLACCGGYQLFHIRDSTHEKEVSASWTDIRGLAAAGIFVAKNVPLVHALTTALDGIALYRPNQISNSALPDTLLPDVPEQALYCNSDFCVRMLNRSPALSVPENRKALLRKLLEVLSGGENLDVRRAICYLLHGAQEALEEDHLTLYWSGSEGAIWSEVVRRALHVRGHAWRLIPALLGELLSESNCRALNIKAISPFSAEELLRESGAGCLYGWNPDTSTREAILLAIKDPVLWRELPLHLTVAADLIAVRNVTCYLRGRSNPPASLAAMVQIIDCPVGNPLRPLYEQCNIKEWSPWGVICTALQLPDPSAFCMEILDALDALKDSVAHSETVLRDLKQRAWLPAGTAQVAPRCVLSLNGLQHTLHRLLGRPELSSRLHEVDHVAELARKHPGFAVVRKHLLPSSTEILALLADGVALIGDYTVGEPVLGGFASETVVQLLEAFAGVDLARLPGLHLLQEIAGQEDLRPHVGILYTALRKPLTLGNWRHFFAALREGYSEQVGPRVYTAYFRALVRRPEFCRADLEGLPLRDGRANWKTAGRLCEDFSGIDLSDRLHTDLLRILREEERQHRPEAYPGENLTPGDRPSVSPTQAADVLDAYFRPWVAAGVREAVIGLFLAFISDQEDILALARKYLGGRHPIDYLRKRLGWRTLDVGRWGTSDQDQYLWQERAQRELRGYGIYYSLSGEAQQVAFGRRAFLFVTEEDQADGTVAVTNLLGERFQARRNSLSDSLFLGEVAFVRIQGQLGGVQVCLRRLDVERLERDTLHNLLYEASCQLLRDVYAQRSDTLLALFEEMAQSEQLDIEATQRGILKSTFFYFRLLDTRKQQKIGTLAKQWFDLDYEEENESKATGGRSVEVDRKRTLMLKELKALLEGDADVQAEILTAVRGKVRQQQYTVQSILFELFQNADDAVVEKRIMFGEWKAVPNPELAKRIVLQWSGRDFQWIHWGRTVNRCRGGQFTEEQGRNCGFHSDLWKMLVLSASDKHINGTTGKFGLGFKSVFLLSDTPRLLSGDLRCEIIAGMYPRKLVGDNGATSERLQKALDAAKGSDVREEGTVIDLPLRQGVQVSEALADFLELAHLLPVFAHLLRRIELRPAEGAPESTWWKPKVLAAGLSVGDLYPTRFARERGHVPQRALVIRPGTGTHGLLLAVGPEGIESLPASVPTYWVTMPARGSESGAGIAVNAAFEVDPGRVQLANKEENLVVARSLGKRLNASFVALYELAQNWPNFCGSLLLSVEATPLCFWQSLFKQTLAPFHDDTEEMKRHMVLRQVLWAEGGGMSELLANYPVLPTELPGSYETLTSLPHVRLCAAGLLDREEVFQKVAVWERFRRQHTPGTILSASRAGQPLQRLGVLVTEQTLSLLDVVDDELPSDRRITPGLAECLGTLLTPEFLEAREEGNNSEAESKEKALMRETLREMLFPTEQGNYSPPRDLLLFDNAQDKEESRRASFCPDSNRLAIEFLGAGLDFFKACRGTMYAPAERLVAWGMQIGSEDTTRQKGFLDYLLKGSLCGTMEINANIRDRCWLGALPSSPLRPIYSVSEWTTLLGKAGFSYEDAERRKRKQKPQDLLELQKIAEWWRIYRETQLHEYERRLYPDGGAYLQTLSSTYSRTPEERAAWMQLLLRSSLETMGRVRIEAHSSFLRQHGNAWVRNLVEASSPGEALYADLCRFMDVSTFDIEFLHWARHYAPVSVFANWLDEYVEIILQLDKVVDAEIKQGLDGFLRARHNAYFHGSGIDAPPLTPLLGLGIHFLVRELSRTGVLKNPILRPYCFVPTAKIRRLMDACGLPLNSDSEERWGHSQRIYQYLHTTLAGQAEHFCRDGDVPLQIVASDSRLWGQFLPSIAYLEEDELEWKDWEAAGQDG
jgi:hypothetical protein